jgi:multidrug resistance efflux pump
VSGLLAVVTVRVGDTVKRGQVVARLDDTLLWLGVRKARADAAAARANITALDARIADLKDKRSTARDARSKIRTGLATIATGKQKLATASGQLATGKDAALAQQATLRQARGKLTAGIAALSRQIAQLEKLPQPPAVVIAQLKAKRAALQGQLAQVDAGLGKIGAGLAKIGAGQATIGAASAKLAAGQAKARAGLVTVNAGISKLGDAITKLEKARTLAHAAVPVRDQAVATAKDQAARATIVTPVAGVVTAAMHTGETAMVGAPIVKVRRIGPSQVDTWVTLAELPLARTGTQATVTADSLKGQTLPAVVKTTSSEYAFPPSAFPTTEIHMLRTIRVTLELEAPGSLLPPGTPVDVTFATK